MESSGLWAPRPSLRSSGWHQSREGEAGVARSGSLAPARRAKRLRREPPGAGTRRRFRAIPARLPAARRRRGAAPSSARRPIPAAPAPGTPAPGRCRSPADGGLHPAERESDRRDLGGSGGAEGVPALRHPALDGAGRRHRHPHHRLALLQRPSGPERPGSPGARRPGVHRLRRPDRRRTKTLERRVAVPPTKAGPGIHGVRAAALALLYPMQRRVNDPGDTERVSVR